MYLLCFYMRTHVACRLITLGAVTVIHLSLYTAPLNLVYYERAAGEQPTLSLFTFEYYAPCITFILLGKTLLCEMMTVHMSRSVHLRGTFLIDIIPFYFSTLLAV